MHIISEPILKQFWATHVDSETSLRTWYKTVKKAQWRSTADVKETFNSASFVGNFTVFNIGGNKYRLIAKINYLTGKLYIRDVLTHKEYDKNKWKEDEWYN